MDRVDGSANELIKILVKKEARFLVNVRFCFKLISRQILCQEIAVFQFFLNYKFTCNRVRNPPISLKSFLRALAMRSLRRLKIALSCPQ
jgi:hypothetical protein